MSKPESAGALEQLGTGIDSLRRWSSMVWRLGVLMAKGAYLLGERRRIFVKLGEEVYARVQRGEIKDEQLQPLVHQLERLTKKVELEEMLIRSLRFGKRAAREAAQAESGFSPSESSAKEK